MHQVVPAVLLITAFVHALPALGALGVTQLVRLYGVAMEDASLALLMRHRAVLFGLLAAFLAYAAFRPALQLLAVVAGLVSVGSFLVLALVTDGYNAAVAKVVRVDVALLVLLVVAGAVQLRGG